MNNIFLKIWIRALWIFQTIISFFNKNNNNNMADFLTDYAAQYLEVLELPGESSFETALKEMLTGFVASAVSAQKIQTLSDAGDTKVLGVSASLTALALKFNKAFPDLSEAEQEQINAVVAGIVTGDNELDAETWFNLVLKSIGKGQKLAKEATLLLETVPPVE